MKLFRVLLFSLPFIVLPREAFSAGHSMIDPEAIKEIERHHGKIGYALLGWEPKGKTDLRIPSECSPQQYRYILSSAKSYYQWSQKAKSFYKRCERSLWVDKPASQSIAFIRTALIQYNYLSRPEFKAYIFKNSEGLKIRYHIGLRPGEKKWPLVVVKCGVLCDVDAGQLARQAMMLFDEGPFHVALVPSVTGGDYLKTNKVFAVGGVEEGRQLFQFVNHLKNEFSHRGRISSIHILSGSLGSNAALFTSLFNTYYDGPVKSVLSGCSVIDLEKTLKYLFSKRTIQSFFIHRQISKEIEAVQDDIAPVQSFFKLFNLKKLVFGLVPDLFKHVALSFYPQASVRKGWALKPFDKIPLKDAESIFEAHQFQKFANNVRVPVLLMTAENDGVVNTQINMSELYRYSSNVDHSGAFFQSLIPEKGGHCDFSHYHGWSISGMTTRSFFEFHSPELRNRIHYSSFSLAGYLNPKTLSLRPGRQTKVTDLKWKVSPHSQEVELVESYYATVYTGGPRSASGSTTLLPRLMKYSVPFTLFSRFTGWRVPTSKAEAQAYTRYLNVNTDLLTAEGALAVRADQINQIRIRYFQ